MPEVVIPEKYVDQIPRFSLPKELTNQPEPEVVVDKEIPVPAAPPKEEAKAVAEAATPPSAESPDAELEKDKDPEKASQRRFERRIDRAHRQRAEALSRAEAAEQRLQELQAKAPQSPSSGKPRVEDFTDIAEFEKAVDKHARSEAVKDYERGKANEAVQAATLRLTQGWEERASKGASQYDDWDEVVGELKPVTPWASAIMEAENGEEIAYYLGKHLTEAKKLFAMNPLSQVREIGKLEMKLAQKPDAPRTPSKAPPPIAPVTGAAVTTADGIKPGQSFEEYRKIGNKMFRGRS